MATFFETVLLSGRCVRLIPLKTMTKLTLERRVAQMKGDEVTEAIFTVATCLKAYTAPRPILFVQKQVTRDGKLVDEPSEVVDMDAMLDAVPAKGAWIEPTFESLITEGDGHVTAIFEDLPDWLGIKATVLQVSGLGAANGSILSGKARVVSVGP